MFSPSETVKKNVHTSVNMFGSTPVQQFIKST